MAPRIISDEPNRRLHSVPVSVPRTKYDISLRMNNAFVVFAIRSLQFVVERQKEFRIYSSGSSEPEGRGFCVSLPVLIEAWKSVRVQLRDDCASDGFDVVVLCVLSMGFTAINSD